MKILHVINGLEVGGAEKFLLKLIANDTKNEHVVLNISKKGKIEELLKRITTVINFNLKENFFKIRIFYKLLVNIKNMKIDAIQGWMYHGNFFSFFIGFFINNKNINWNIRGPYDTKLTKFSTKIILYICSFFSKLFKIKVIYNSNYALSNHTKIGYNLKNTFMIHNGYQIKKKLTFNRQKKFKKINFNKCLVIGNVARYDSHKDHLNLFSSLYLLKKKNYKFKLLIVGENINFRNKSLIKLIDKFDLRENILIFRTRTNLDNFYSLIDIHILSSISESFPNVVAESMLSNIPSISTNVGDVKYLISEYGWIVPPNNPEKMCQTIIDVIKFKSDIKEWQNIKKKCNEHIIKNFNLDKSIKKYNLCWGKKI